MTISSPREPATSSRLAELYQAVRHQSEVLCEPLVPEDYVIQSMEDVSPTKWHLAHTSWFFETFALREYLADYQELHPRYAYLFNSYYVQAGDRHCRPKRGLVSRPTVEEIYEYRRHVDEAMTRLLVGGRAGEDRRLAEIIEIGLHHEQQHQELMVYDFKHVLSMNPLYPAYLEREVPVQSEAAELGYVAFAGGLTEIGHTGGGFSFDNERPRHRVHLEPFALASRLVTNGEYLRFVQDGGYDRPEIWLSDGFATRQREGWRAPYYWEQRADEWWMITLQGPRPVNLAEPVMHVSHYEADAFARWAGARLPSEFEWEGAASTVPVGGNFVERRRFHAEARDSSATPTELHQLWGDVWEWTASAYLPYPGFRTLPGALGEYNGKFMANQMVLRGGSCATPADHIRPTYRNFFHPDRRWIFSGFRLARDA